MRAVILLTVVFLFIVQSPPTLMQDNAGAEVDLSPIVIPDTQSISLISAINGTDYFISVALPASYTTSDQSYPVLYLLDPLGSFLSVTEYVRYSAFFNELPELIVVGIGYPTTDHINEFFALRDQDYIRSQDEFLEFISEELIPLVDSTYRTDITDRALVGFSDGGRVVFHALVNKPELFNRYVAIDSSSSGELTMLLTGADTTFRESLAGLNVKLLIAEPQTEHMSATIQNQAYEGLEAIGLSLGDVTHVAAQHIALPAAIKAVYVQ